IRSCCNDCMRALPHVLIRFTLPNPPTKNRERTCRGEETPGGSQETRKVCRFALHAQLPSEVRSQASPLFDDVRFDSVVEQSHQCLTTHQGWRTPPFEE